MKITAEDAAKLARRSEAECWLEMIYDKIREAAACRRWYLDVPFAGFGGSAMPLTPEVFAQVQTELLKSKFAVTTLSACQWRIAWAG